MAAVSSAFKLGTVQGSGRALEFMTCGTKKPKSGMRGSLYEEKWLLPQIGGSFLGWPDNQCSTFLGSILGPLILEAPK